MFIRTPRLLLRPGWIEDTSALAEAFGDHAIATKVMHAPWPYGRKEAEEYLRHNKPAHLPEFLAFVRTGGSPRLVGGVGLAQHEDGVEIGYWIARRYWGLGFATEAAAAVVRLAEQGLRITRLISGHFVDNPASGNVLRKLGFTPTGRTVARPCLARGTEVPCVMFARRSLSAGSGDHAMAA